MVSAGGHTASLVNQFQPAPICPALIDCSAEDYYADRIFEEPTLTQSIARILLEQSPFHAHNAHPRMGGHSRRPNDAMDTGTLFHGLVLGDESGIVEVFANDFRTKAARATRDEAYAQGKTPVITTELAQARARASTYKSRIRELGIELGGKSEQTVVWVEKASNGRLVKCRARLDHLLYHGEPFNIAPWWSIFDLKTSSKTAAGHPDNFADNVYRNGYDIQAAAYTRAIQAVYPGDQVDFTFLVAELEAPYAVSAISLSPSYLDVGHLRWKRAVDIWADCYEKGKWPSYTTGEVRVDPPQWVIRKEMAYV